GNGSLGQFVWKPTGPPKDLAQRKRIRAFFFTEGVVEDPNGPIACAVNVGLELFTRPPVWFERKNLSMRTDRLRHGKGYVTFLCSNVETDVASPNCLSDKCTHRGLESTKIELAIEFVRRIDEHLKACRNARPGRLISKSAKPSIVATGNPFI